MPEFQRTQTFTHEIGTDGTLRVRTSRGDVTVEAADGTHARVEAAYHLRATDDEAADRIVAAEPVSVALGDGSLDVEDRELRGGLLAGLGIIVGQRSVGVDLRITVPRGTNVRINGVSSDLLVRGIHGRQDLKTISGDVIVREAGGEVSANSVSGNVIISAVGPAAVESSTTSGDVVISGPLLRSCRVQSVSGDVEIAGRFSPDGEHRVGTVSGDLRMAPDGGVTLQVSGLSTTVRSEIEHRTDSNAGRRVTIVGDGAARMTFRSMSGNVRITRASERGPVERYGAGQAEVPQAPHRAAAPEAPSGPSREAPLEPADDLAILRALERGEIDVDEASRLLAGVSNDG
jgi:DUF4097 and DUF4098 domain-containing protein YvlB